MLVANQSPTCVSIHQDNYPDNDRGEDIVHICDWPAFKEAMDAFQVSRGGPV